MCHECCSLSINILLHCCLLKINLERTAYKKSAANMTKQMSAFACCCECCNHCHIQCRGDYEHCYYCDPAVVPYLERGDNSNSQHQNRRIWHCQLNKKLFTQGFIVAELYTYCSCNHFERCLWPTPNCPFHSPTYTFR